MKVGILGCGAYGLALCSILHKNKNNITLWSYNEDEVALLSVTRKSNRLIEYTIPDDVNITASMSNVCDKADLIVVSVPAFAFESTIKKLSSCLNKKTIVLIATKGIQNETCEFLHNIFKKYSSNNYAIISGPTFASDIILDIPVGFSLATKSPKANSIVRKCFENNKTKFRTTRDITGVEICASVKNVIAIASGMLDGMYSTPSTKALFLTESLNDIKELIHALGGKKSTIMSFAGFGDILMTCTSVTSRNYSFGYLIGKGASNDEINDYLNRITVEGMYTLKSIHKLVKKKNVSMPIINLIYDIVNGKKNKEDILTFLIEK